MKTIERRPPGNYPGINSRSPRVAARPRSNPKHQNDPRGQFGAFLRDWIDRHERGESLLAERLDMSRRSIRSWVVGDAGPTFGDLDAVAKALEFDDYAAMFSAIKAFKSSKR